MFTLITKMKICKSKDDYVNYNGNDKSVKTRYNITCNDNNNNGRVKTS